MHLKVFIGVLLVLFSVIVTNAGQPLTPSSPSAETQETSFFKDANNSELDKWSQIINLESKLHHYFKKALVITEEFLEFQDAIKNLNDQEITHLLSYCYKSLSRSQQIYADHSAFVFMLLEKKAGITNYDLRQLLNGMFFGWVPIIGIPEPFVNGIMERHKTATLSLADVDFVTENLRKIREITELEYLGKINPNVLPNIETAIINKHAEMLTNLLCIIGSSDLNESSKNIPDQNMQRFVREVLQFKSLVQQFFHLEGKLANRLFEEIEKKHSNVKDNLLKEASMSVEKCMQCLDKADTFNYISFEEDLDQYLKEYHSSWKAAFQDTYCGSYSEAFAKLTPRRFISYLKIYELVMKSPHIPSANSLRNSFRQLENTLFYQMNKTAFDSFIDDAIQILCTEAEQHLYDGAFANRYNPEVLLKMGLLYDLIPNFNYNNAEIAVKMMFFILEVNSNPKWMTLIRIQNHNVSEKMLAINQNFHLFLQNGPQAERVSLGLETYLKKLSPPSSEESPEKSQEKVHLRKAVYKLVELKFYGHDHEYPTNDEIQTIIKICESYIDDKAIDTSLKSLKRAYGIKYDIPSA